MTRQLLFFSFLLCGEQTTKAQFNYPASKTVDSSDSWHQVTVKDPYRWLEDMKNPEVISWYKKQASFTDSMLHQVPYADMLFNEMMKLEVSQPQQKFGIKRIANAVFYNQVKQGEEKVKIYRQSDNANVAQVIASPEMWGQNFNITNYELSPSEQYIAIVAREGGKEINHVKIYSITENKILPDKIEGSFKGFLNNQNNMFYYVQPPAHDPASAYNHNEEIFKTHVIGTDTSLDIILTSKQTNPEIMSFTEGKYLWEIETFKGCNYEFAWVVQSSSAEIWYRNKSVSNKWKQLFDAANNVYNIFHFNNRIYYTCFKDAPNGVIKMLDLSNPSAPHKRILQEQADPLDYDAITETKNYLIAAYKRNGITSFSKFIFMPANKITASPFKENTARTRYFGINKYKNDSLLIVREGWADFPLLTYAAANSNKEIPSQYYIRQVLPFEDNLVVEEVEVLGYDGALVPLTIIRRKDLRLNGNNIAIINGYGAYGEPITPYFNQTYAILANKGVVVCFAHVRGGGEKGSNWHIAGMKQSKSNSWKDFNSCAEYLIDKGYTTAAHLSCEGGSAGGILIGRAITERPDLWACAIPEVGVMNILRGEYSAYGKSQTDEFGTVDDINEFFSILESDALLHIQKGIKYPAMLVVTGWDDPRVSSWQCGKFAAAAQNATTSGKPVLLKINFNGGHGGDMTGKQAAMKEQAKKYAFILWQCGFDKANKYD